MTRIFIQQLCVCVCVCVCLWTCAGGTLFGAGEKREITNSNKTHSILQSGAYDANYYSMHHNCKIKKSDLLEYVCILQMNKNMKLLLGKWIKGISKQSVEKK